MEAEKEFSEPARSFVSAINQVIFEKLQRSLDFVPNLYIHLAKNGTMLADYLVCQNCKIALSARAIEMLSLVTGQANELEYRPATDSAWVKEHDFTDKQIFYTRQGLALFDDKLDALANFRRSIVKNERMVCKSGSEAFENQATAKQAILISLPFRLKKSWSSDISNTTLHVNTCFQEFINYLLTFKL